MLNRAYSLLEIKAIDEPARRIRGIATTPTPDRLGDIIDPLGADYPPEIPLLLHHRQDTPVGTARLGRATPAGIPFDAEIPIVDEPGPVKQETDRAWQSIRHGLIRGVSIGFRPRPRGVEPLPGGGARFVKTEILELSLVTVPANQDATIAIVRSLDQAAMGQTSPGVAGAFPVVARRKDAPAMTISEQITQWSNTRAPKSDRMAAIMKSAADTGVTLDDAAAEEYEGLKTEIKSIDAHLARLRDMEAINAAAAVPITTTPPRDPVAPSSRPTSSVIQVKSRLEPGTAFVRAACAVLVCRGNFDAAANYAGRRWNDSTPEVELYLRAAVAAGNTTDATWAGPLVNQNISSEFIELLRPATILGKIPNLRNVPFNTKVPSQTAGGTYGWVGQAAPKPVTKLAFGSVLLDIAKAAGIIVLTEELVRLSNPSAETLVRADMIAGIAQFLDTQFIDPAVAAVAGVNPASITNGAPNQPATTPLPDLLTLINHFTTNNIPIGGLAFIMSPANALAWSFYTDATGARLFPDLTMEGGTVQGIRVITSQAAGSNVIAVQPQLILYADDGGVTIDASREASLQMDSAPDNPQVATSLMVSLWQNNLVGLRAERFVNWKRSMTNAVMYLTAAAYPAPSRTAAEPAPKNGGSQQHSKS